jgi:hypothetical protein
MATRPVAATIRAIWPGIEFGSDWEGFIREREVGRTDAMLRFLSNY